VVTTALLSTTLFIIAGAPPSTVAYGSVS
jgi:hypothetical protein